MMEALRSYEKAVHTRAIRRNTREAGILHRHHRKTSNLTQVREMSFTELFMDTSHHGRLNPFKDAIVASE
jgi:hypothetical protein